MVTGVQRLTAVCEASNVPYDNYGSSIRKDADNRVPCPICKKIVKLKKVSGHGPWPNTIPHHHMGRLAAAVVADMQEHAAVVDLQERGALLDNGLFRFLRTMDDPRMNLVPKTDKEKLQIIRNEFAAFLKKSTAAMKGQTS